MSFCCAFNYQIKRKPYFLIGLFLLNLAHFLFVIFLVLIMVIVCVKPNLWIPITAKKNSCITGFSLLIVSEIELNWPAQNTYRSRSLNLTAVYVRHKTNLKVSTRFYNHYNIQLLSQSTQPKDLVGYYLYLF